MRYAVGQGHGTTVAAHDDIPMKPAGLAELGVAEDVLDCRTIARAELNAWRRPPRAIWQTRPLCRCGTQHRHPRLGVTTDRPGG